MLLKDMGCLAFQYRQARTVATLLYEMLFPRSYLTGAIHAWKMIVLFS
jgi:hypothetical protein